jgi:hypothetical protein
MVKNKLADYKMMPYLRYSLHHQLINNDEYKITLILDRIVKLPAMDKNSLAVSHCLAS